MIYIRNYSNIRAQLPGAYDDALFALLRTLSGRCITVFTPCASKTGGALTGVLVSVRADRIVLITDTRAQNLSCTKRITRAKSMNTHTVLGSLTGTAVVVFIAHICALSYSQST